MSSNPLPEAIVSANLFQLGVGYVLLSRFKSNERVESGVFLVDVFCLGVKDAMYVESYAPQYERDIVLRFFREKEREQIQPCCARKLVEGAVEFAMGLGFQPHRDFKKACRVFGGIDPRSCGRQFVFGREGMPLYVQGPKESSEQANRILQLLRARCGEGKFKYLVLADSGRRGSRNLPDPGR